MYVKSKIATIFAAMTISLAAPAFSDGHINADTIVATVNGEEITLGHMISLRQRLPQQYQQLPGDVLFEGILDQLVQQTLLAANVEGLSKGAQLTLENEERALRAAEEIRLVNLSSASDEAIQAAYDATYGGTEPETEYNASHILVETEEEANAIVTELEGGADFAEMAREKSTGPSGPGGGELGWFGKGSMVAPFEEAVIAADPGSVAGPVQTQFGWHVIKVNETRIKNAPPLEQVRGQLEENIRREAIEAHVGILTDDAAITRMTAEEVNPEMLNNLSLLEN